MGPLQNFNKGTFDTAALREIRKARVRVVLAMACSEDIAKIALDALRLGLTAG